MSRCWARVSYVDLWFHVFSRWFFFFDISFVPLLQDVEWVPICSISFELWDDVFPKASKQGSHHLGSSSDIEMEKQIGEILV